jgi:chromatin remodeling complex protein RSC6
MAAKKVNSALSKPLEVSAELAAVIGKGPMPRTEVVKKLWAYIKKNNLQNPKNKRISVCFFIIW